MLPGLGAQADDFHVYYERTQAFIFNVLFVTSYLNHSSAELAINLIDGAPLIKIDATEQFGVWIDSEFIQASNSIYQK